MQSIPQDIIALASYKCRDFARALLNCEAYIARRCPFDPNTTAASVTSEHGVQMYQLLQQINQGLEDVDGMAGLASKRPATSLDEDILDHRANGGWTHALSCYEKAVQSQPQTLKYREGLLQCQMELGHLETTIANATGMIARKPEWKSELNGYRVHAAWRLCDWTSLHSFVKDRSLPCFETSMGQIIAAAQQKRLDKFNSLIADARDGLLRKLSAVSSEFGSYEQCGS